MNNPLNRPDESYYQKKAAIDKINYDKLVNLYIELGDKFQDFITEYDATDEIISKNLSNSLFGETKDYTKNDFICDILYYVKNICDLRHYPNNIRLVIIESGLRLKNSDKLLEFIENKKLEFIENEKSKEIKEIQKKVKSKEVKKEIKPKEVKPKESKLKEVKSKEVKKQVKSKEVKKEEAIEEKTELTNMVKKKSIPLALKRNVWNKYIGESIGKALCECCKLTDITQLNFSCGHIISEFNGGLIKLDNLKPICASCNSSMGTKNMDDFIKEYGLK